MPTLDLLSEPAMPSFFDLCRLRYVMLFPSPDLAELRDQALQAECAEYYLRSQRDEDREENTSGDLQLLRSLPRSSDLRRMAQLPFKHGVIAGYRFGSILDKLSNNPAASFKSAGVDERIKTIFRVSQSTIDSTIWPMFKSVVHFWAVYVDCCRQDVDYSFPCRTEHLGRFLAVADALRRLGASEHIKQSKGKILESIESWLASPQPPPARLHFWEHGAATTTEL